MFLKELKALLVIAMRNTFSDDYPVADFQNLSFDIEFPIDRANYPSVWVDFEPTGPLEAGGVDQQLYIPDAIDTHTFRSYQLWRYQGFATYTVVALSSLERDRIFDELVRVMAFASQNPLISTFRATIDNNDLIAANMGFNEIQIRGNSEVPGTPWGTEEILYETTLAIQILGEFAGDLSSGELLPLSEIDITPTIQGGPTEETIKIT